MLTILTDVELRVLGSLIEKQITTPGTIITTLNARPWPRKEQPEPHYGLR